MQHRQPRRRSVREQSITTPRRAAPTQLHRQTKDRTPLTTGTIVVHMRHRHRCRRVCEQLITTLCCVTGWPPVQLGLRGGNAVPHAMRHRQRRRRCAAQQDGHLRNSDRTATCNGGGDRGHGRMRPGVQAANPGRPLWTRGRQPMCEATHTWLRVKG
ncbi:hypothetical protein F4815DRAFT_441871 [Daldinia loculata]|nr:hypothetical protein F4815DRAFT_441871 [Daldinia loculata]